MLRSFPACLLVPAFLAVASSGTLVAAAPPLPVAAVQNDGGLAVPRPIAPDVPFAANNMRKALELPTSEAQFGFNADYSPVIGTTWRWQFDPAPDANAEVERLTATLKNTDEDAATWLRIGYFRGQQGDGAGAHEAYQKAETLFRAQVAQRPQDAVPLQGLGATLSSLDRGEEAEKVLRAAVKLAPNDPHGLILLAGLITSQISAPLFADLARAAALNTGVAGDALQGANADGGADKNDLPTVMARLLASADPDKLQVAQVRLQETKTLNDLAVALSPHDPVVYIERAGGAFSRATVEQALAKVSAARDQQNRPATPDARREAITNLLVGAFQSLGTALLNPDSQADLEHAAQFLAPAESVRLRTMAVLIGALRPSWEPDTTPEQVAAARANSLANLSEIEKLAQTTQPPNARMWAMLALARMTSAGFQNEYEDDEQTLALRKGAEEAARHALAVDENQSVAWDVLMITVSKDAERLSEMQQLATRRLALASTASNQFILARNLALQHKDQEALQQIETALKTTPDNWLLRLLRATLLLRQPDEASLTAAVPLVAELGRAPQANSSDAELLNILNGVMLARLHRFYEAELVLAANRTGGEGPTAVAYSALMADVEEFAHTLAAAKRHEEVLVLARLLMNLPIQMPQRYFLDNLGLSAEEYAALTKQ